MLLAGVPTLVNSYRAATTAAEATHYARAIAGIIGFEASTWTATGLGYIYYRHHSNQKMPFSRKRTYNVNTTGGNKFIKSALIHSLGSANPPIKRLVGTGPRRSTLYDSRNMRHGGVIGRFQPTPHGTEHKWLDTPMSITPASTAALHTTEIPTVITRATGPNSRIGLGVVVKSLQFRGTMRHDPLNDADGDATYYFYLILDKECNGVHPALGDVFTSTNLNESHVNLANSKRFTILKKMKFNFQTKSGVTTAWAPETRLVEFYMKASIPMRWTSDNTSGSLSGQTQNSIFWIDGTDRINGRGVLSGNFRIRFEDA